MGKSRRSSPSRSDLGQGRETADDCTSPNQDLAQEQLRNLYVANADYAIFVVDPAGYIKTWNHGAVRIKQYAAEEAIGRHFSMLYPRDAAERDEPMEHLREAKAKGIYHAEGERVRKNGQSFLADVLITPMYRDGNLIGFSKVVADVSEQGRIREERDESREKVKELQIQRRLRERFVATLTHDLRNPLAAVRTALEMIQARHGDRETQARLVKIALGSLARVDRMISDLLDSNRITSGEPLPLHPEPLDLKRITEETVTELTMVHGNRLRFVGGGPIVGEWDRAALKRVIENLAVNAIKYGDPASPVTVALSAAEKHVFLSVHNFGPPISAEDQRLLFQEFRRSISASASKKKGWGLGLTLVRGIAEAHGGTVLLDSDPARGTTFTVALPLRAEDAGKLRLAG